jgi:hypothetical protein
VVHVNAAAPSSATGTVSVLLQGSSLNLLLHMLQLVNCRPCTLLRKAVRRSSRS